MKISQIIVLIINVIGIAFGIYCLLLDYKSLGLITIGAHILWAAIVLTQNDNYESVPDKKSDEDNEEETYGEKVEEYLNVTLKNDGKGMYKGSLIIYDKDQILKQPAKKGVLKLVLIMMYLFLVTQMTVILLWNM